MRHGLTQVSQVPRSSESEDLMQSFRRFPPSGALYPSELYAYLKIEGLPAGVYHYDAAHHRLVLLREGNFDSYVTKALVEPLICPLALARFSYRRCFGKTSTNIITFHTVCKVLMQGCFLDSCSKWRNALESLPVIAQFPFNTRPPSVPTLQAPFTQQQQDYLMLKAAQRSVNLPSLSSPSLGMAAVRRCEGSS